MARLRIAPLVRKARKQTPVTRQVVRDIVRSVQELKVFSPSAVTAQTAATTGTLARLTDISQGDDIGNRSGDTITMKNLTFRFNAFDLTAARSSSFRVIIFSDSMGSGAAIAVTEFLQSASHLSPYSGINRQRNRFKVFYDNEFAVVGATNFQERPHSLELPINQRRYFNDTGATATNIGKNALYVLFIASAANATYDFHYQLTYTDS